MHLLWVNHLLAYSLTLFFFLSFHAQRMVEKKNAQRPKKARSSTR